MIPLRRQAGVDRAAAPVRLVHLGLGNFFRAHQAWYTDRSPDAAGWGIAAFSGRRPDLAERLAAQDGLYTLVTRAADGDRFDVVSSISAAHPGGDHAAWLAYLSSPEVAAVTLTVTEAGYVRRADGALDLDNPAVRADLAALRADPGRAVQTAPGRLVAGLAARRRADAGPLTVVPCDNLPDNAAVVTRVVRELAERVDPALADWIDGTVRYVTTMVDRITPATAPEDLHAMAASTGRRDRAPVVTEPFAEWVLSGTFAAGRPAWDAAGATVTDDVTPFEQRKLWLLNGGHSLLAYAGSITGHQTVADAMDDPTVRAWLAEWWAEASAHVPLPPADVAAYQAALVERFTNRRIRHHLAQIAADGSQKVPVRVLPVLRRERATGRVPTGASRALAAWVCHLRGAGVPVNDARAEELVPLVAGPLTEAVPRLLQWLDPQLSADAAVVAAVRQHAAELAAAAVV